MRDISSAVVASMELATLPTSMGPAADHCYAQSLDNRKVMDLGKASNPASEPVLNAANITCIVDDDPAPRSQVSSVRHTAMSDIHSQSAMMPVARD